LKTKTEILNSEARWGRKAEVYLIGEKMVFDCSDGEYGPVEVTIEEIEKRIREHKQKMLEKNKN
jgi:hypothetical protein